MRPSIGHIFLFILLPEFSLGLNETALQTEISQLSECDLGCMIPGVIDAGCNIANVTSIQSCLCMNGTAESLITDCIISKCGFMDHIESASVQQWLCEGKPHPTRQPQLLFATIFLSCLVMICVALRCWSRYTISKEFWWDDWVVLFSTVLFLVLQGLTIWGIKQGFGLHIWDADIVTLQTSIETHIYQFLYELFFCFVQYSTRVSILLFYYRAFLLRWMHITIYIFCAFLTIQSTIFTAMTIFQCHPITRIFNDSLQNGTCMDYQRIILTAAIMDILEDIAILCLPIPSILALRLNLRKKVAVVFAMSVGLISIIASLIRLRYVIGFADSNDALWDNFGIAITSMVDMSLSIICVCFLAIRHLLKRHFPSLLSSPSSDSNIMRSLKFINPNTRSSQSQQVGNPDLESNAKLRSLGSRLLKWFDGLLVFKDNESTKAFRSREEQEERGEEVVLGEIRQLSTPNIMDRIDTAEKASSHTHVISAL